MLALPLFAFGPMCFAVASDASFPSSNPWRYQITWLDGIFSKISSWIDQTSAFNRIGEILFTGFSDPPISFQVTSNLVAGLCFLLMGWALFELCTKNEKPAMEARGLLFKRVGGAGIFGAGRTWRPALMWKDFHFIGGGRIMILLKIVLYSTILGFMAWSTNTWNRRFDLEDFGEMAMSCATFALVIEAGIQASRVFYTEVKWKTLSSIVLLPKGIATIAYSKIAGVAISLLPALTLLVIGACCAPESFFEVVFDMLEEPGVWYFVSQIFLFIHLAALLSLYVKWGALPITFAAIYGGNMMMMFMFTMIMRGGFDEAIFVLLAFATFFLCVFIHGWIGYRLKQIATT